MGDNLSMSTTHRHKWNRPHALVGGLKENPGVFGDSGGGISVHEVCVCGASRHTKSSRTGSGKIRTETRYPQSGAARTRVMR